MHPKKSIIIGIGKAGCNFIDNLSAQKTIPAIGIEPKIINPELIRSYTQDATNIFLICGLGSLTSGLKVQTILDEISNKSAKIYLMGLLPFAFEGVKRIRSANNTIAQIKDHVTKIFEFENQMLVDTSASGTTLTEAFGKMDNLVWNQIVQIIPQAEDNEIFICKAEKPV